MPLLLKNCSQDHSYLHYIIWKQSKPIEKGFVCILLLLLCEELWKLGISNYKIWNIRYILMFRVLKWPYQPDIIEIFATGTYPILPFTHPHSHTPIYILSLTFTHYHSYSSVYTLSLPSTYLPLSQSLQSPTLIDTLQPHLT